MAERALTPHTTVTIGQQTRVYLALATTAPSSSAGTVSAAIGDLRGPRTLGASRLRGSSHVGPPDSGGGSGLGVAPRALPWAAACIAARRPDARGQLNRCRDGGGSGWRRSPSADRGVTSRTARCKAASAQLVPPVTCAALGQGNIAPKILARAHSSREGDHDKLDFDLLSRLLDRHAVKPDQLTDCASPARCEAARQVQRVVRRFRA
jgi:hypothetical protein